MAANEHPAALEDHLGFWLRVLSNHVHRSFETKLERFGVTVPQWGTLRRLFDVDAVSVSELAQRVGVDQGAMSRMVERLIQRELVVREADPADGRATRIKLTPAGRKLVPKLAEAADRNDSDFFEPLTARERSELSRVVRKLVEVHRVPIDANK